MKTNPKSILLPVSEAPDLSPTVGTLEDAYQFLKAHWQVLPESDHHFAQQMLLAYEKPGHGSLNQQFYLKKKAKQAGWHKTQAGYPNDAGLVKKKIGGFALLAKKFKQAKDAGIKYPKVVVKLLDGNKLQLTLSTSKSAKPNTISLTDGKPYEQNQWYGRIDMLGNWVQPKTYKPVVFNTVNNVFPGTTTIPDIIEYALNGLEYALGLGESPKSENLVVLFDNCLFMSNVTPVAPATPNPKPGPWKPYLPKKASSLGEILKKKLNQEVKTDISLPDLTTVDPDRLFARKPPKKDQDIVF